MNVSKRLITLLAVAALLASCAGTSSSSSPTSPKPTPAIADRTPPAATPSAVTPSAGPTTEPTHVAAHWEGAGTMVWPRRDPTAVVLGDGRVLVLGETGGKYEEVPEDSRFAELWDPTTGTWSETEYLPKARGSFAAVTLHDGRALVAGGVNDMWFSYSSAYVFDPATEGWTKVGLMGTARTDPAVAVLADGRVLVAGGMYHTGLKHEARAGLAVLAGGIKLADTWPGPEGYALAAAELFDPTTGTWSATGPMRYARATPSAVTLADGRVLVAGAGWGDRVDDRAQTTTEIYDPATGRFTLADDLPEAVDQSFFEQLGVPASDRCDQADIGGCRNSGGAGRWGRDPPRQSLGLHHRGAGGCRIAVSHPLLRFTAATGAWDETGLTAVELLARGGWRMGVRKGWGQDHPDGIVVPMRGGQILVTGGAGEDGLGIRTAKRLDPTTGAWSSLPDMPGARATAAGVTLSDGSVLIVGGWSNGGDGYPVQLADTFRFIPGS